MHESRAMSTITNIPADWQRWLQDNIARNVPDETMLDVMVKSRFDKDAVLQCIAFLRKRPSAMPITGLPQPTPFNDGWQLWLAENIHKGVIEQTLIDATTREIRSAWGKRITQLRNQNEAITYTYEAPAFKVGAAVQTHDRLVSVLIDIDKPRIVLFGNVLSAEECEQMIAMAQPKMAPSVTIDNATARPVVTKNRSSDGTFLRLGETPFVERIEQRLADLACWPVANGEGLQILSYKDGGEYVAHFDFFPPEQPNSVQMLKHGGQRVATLIVYLNTVEEGGETYFPKLNLKIKAVQGNALYFHYTNSKTELDRMTLHGGSPATKGEKWIMTKWMRQNVVTQPGSQV